MAGATVRLQAVFSRRSDDQAGSLPSLPFRDDDSGLLSRDAALSLLVALVLPVLLFTAHLGALNRTVYPATAFLLGGFLYHRRSPWYLGLCLWLFCASPFVRRLTDLQAGWDPANPVLIAPYLACLFSVLSLLPYSSRSRAPFVTPFLVIITCVAYGTLLAVLDERVISSLMDALRWGVGPLCAVYLLRYANHRRALHRVVVNSLLAAGPAMAAYGIAQFLDPAPWDREWMTNVLSLGLDSIGQPAPFQVRVFGPMNSPASFAMFLMVCSLLYLSQPLSLLLPAMLLIAPCLALTQYRAGWGGLAVGLLCLLLSGAARDRVRIASTVAILVFASSFLALAPEISQTIADRFDTLSRLSGDQSGQDRINEYQAFLTNTENLVQGQGLAISGAVRQLDGKPGLVIDGGIMEPFLAFGVFGGTAFLGSVLAIFFRMWRRPSFPCTELPFYRSIVTASFAQILFGRVLIGEGGFCAWLAVGLAVAELAQPLLLASDAIPEQRRH